MNINLGFLPYILLITSCLPALLAVLLAKRQNRSKLVSGAVTFVLGFTWIGGWIYLAIMNLVHPKPSDNTVAR